ncbi:hypothetical protein E1A91_A11G225400v1 [Gossypium mustelinum]|uniref:Uncharacterized protein n=1 Tax=Gossypium mustelinum TaxID=34275 RepID=A0A5D2XCW4_GOSMU|nr:hypothetical protein E1A91_A11G225400v1 [Gossypium mustelinum]
MTLRIPLLRSPKEGKTTVRRAANVATAAPSKKGNLRVSRRFNLPGPVFIWAKGLFYTWAIIFGFCI